MKTIKLKQLRGITTYEQVKHKWDKLNEDGSLVFINYNDDMIFHEVERINSKFKITRMRDENERKRINFDRG